MRLYNPMSLSSSRPENNNATLTDLWIFWFTPTANKVCGLYPFSPERETCCMLPLISFCILALCKKKPFRFIPAICKDCTALWALAHTDLRMTTPFAQPANKVRRSSVFPCNSKMPPLQTCGMQKGCPMTFGHGTAFCLVPVIQLRGW